VLVRRKGETFTGRVTVACELPDFARTLLRDVPFPDGYDVLPISGSEEQTVKHGLADAVLVVTETGSSVRANELEIVPGCESLFISMPQIIALRELDADDEQTLRALMAALRGVVGAQEFILLKADVPSLITVGELELPASVAPSVLPTSDPAWYAVEVCIPRARYGDVAVRLEDAGAKGIVMVPIAGHHV
jgi:ATP phosphoribosyltransferase